MHTAVGDGDYCMCTSVSLHLALHPSLHPSFHPTLDPSLHPYLHLYLQPARQSSLHPSLHWSLQGLGILSLAFWANSSFFVSEREKEQKSKSLLLLFCKEWFALGHKKVKSSEKNTTKKEQITQVTLFFKARRAIRWWSHFRKELWERFAHGRFFLKSDESDLLTVDLL